MRPKLHTHTQQNNEYSCGPCTQALERIAGLLEDGGGSVTLSERGDSTAVARHPAFRLFAAMNPATDAGGSFVFASPVACMHLESSVCYVMCILQYTNVFYVSEAHEDAWAFA